MRQQGDRHEQRRHRQRARRPEEIDALQKADEKRRIAKRRQCAAHVADEQDEEDDCVRPVQPLCIGGDQRADQQHRRAGRAHDARERRSEREQRGVDGGRSGERPAKADAAGDGEQRKQDREERHVFLEDRVRNAVRRIARPEFRRERHEQRERPEQGDLAVVRVPEPWRDERDEGDRQQQPREGQPPRERQCRPAEFRRHRAALGGAVPGRGARSAFSRRMGDRGPFGRGFRAQRARRRHISNSVPPRLPQENSKGRGQRGCRGIILPFPALETLR